MHHDLKIVFLCTWNSEFLILHILMLSAADGESYSLKDLLHDPDKG